MDKTFATARSDNRRCRTTNTCLAVDGDRPLEHAVHAQDGGLRRVDDGRAEQRAEHAAVTDGERAAVHVLHRQLVTASLAGRSRRVGVHFIHMCIYI